MREKLSRYMTAHPEIIFEWNDRFSDARGWVVINSLKNGAAGGGTRMRKGLNRGEVLSLAKVMEIKFTVSGPAIGGAKSGIDFDPEDPRRNEVLRRWFEAVKPLLKHYYGTGGDLNVDEIKDVVPLTEELGLWHPQEGIVSGFFNIRKGDKVKLLGQLRYGCVKVIEDPEYAPVHAPIKYAIADMVTGFGVYKSLEHYYQLFKNEDLQNKKVIVQGWGNVASAAAYYLAAQGAKIMGIIDRKGGLIRKEGFSFDEVQGLFLNKKGNTLQADDLLSFDYVNERIWDTQADIFIPAAASRLVNRDQIDRMIYNGLSVISCGANVPFTDDEYLFGPTAEYTDTRIGLIPDFIANCGMARVFDYLMQPDVEISDDEIFRDISHTIYHALDEIKAEDDSGLKLMHTGLKLALNKISG